MAFYNPTIITIPWAANGQKAAIPNATEAAGRASWPVGFPEVNALPLEAGGIPPNYLDFQGVLYALSVHAMYGQTGARYAWNSAIDYPDGAYVRGSNGVEYVAIAASGPDSGGAVDPAGADASQFWARVHTSQEVVPGIVVAFAGNVGLPGYLLCNGAAVSRTTYAALFSVIGTTYGEGDGSTTFSLPRLTDLRFIQGSGTAGVAREPGLPELHGEIWRSYVSTANGTSGVFSQSNEASGGGLSSGSNQAYALFFNASSYNSIYGASNTVQPPALTMRYYIKY